MAPPTEATPLCTSHRDPASEARDKVGRCLHTAAQFSTFDPGETMREINIGPVHSFGDPRRKVIDSEGLKVRVFKLDDEFFAYESVLSAPWRAGLPRHDCGAARTRRSMRTYRCEPRRRRAGEDQPVRRRRCSSKCAPKPRENKGVSVKQLSPLILGWGGRTRTSEWRNQNQLGNPITSTRIRKNRQKTGLEESMT